MKSFHKSSLFMGDPSLLNELTHTAAGQKNGCHFRNDIFKYINFDKEVQKCDQSWVHGSNKHEATVGSNKYLVWNNEQAFV